MYVCMGQIIVRWRKHSIGSMEDAVVRQVLSLHEPKLVIVLLRDLQRAVRYVGRVEGHEGGLRVVVVFDDIHELLLVEELGVTRGVQRRRALVRVPKVDDRLVAFAAGLHVCLRPKVVFVREVIQRRVVTSALRGVRRCHHPSVPLASHGSGVASTLQHLRLGGCALIRARCQSRGGDVDISQRASVSRGTDTEIQLEPYTLYSES